MFNLYSKDIYNFCKKQILYLIIYKKIFLKKYVKIFGEIK